MTLRDKLFGFEGRLRRRDWWLFSLTIGIFNFTASHVFSMVLSPQPMTYLERLTAMPVEVTLGLWLLTIWPYLAIGVKRLHDRCLPGWPLFPYYLLSAAVSFIPSSAWAWFGTAETLGALAPVLWSVGRGLLALVVFIILGFLDGTQGPNRFGPSPKGIGDAPRATFD